MDTGISTSCQTLVRSRVPQESAVVAETPRVRAIARGRRSGPRRPENEARICAGLAGVHLPAPTAGG